MQQNQLASLSAINQSFASGHSPADQHHQRLFHSSVYLQHPQAHYLAHGHHGGFSQQNIIVGQAHQHPNGFFMQSAGPFYATNGAATGEVLDHQQHPRDEQVDSFADMSGWH